MNNSNTADDTNHRIPNEALDQPKCDAGPEGVNLTCQTTHSGTSRIETNLESQIIVRCNGASQSPFWATIKYENAVGTHNHSRFAIKRERRLENFFARQH
ncbi:MAG TPA: hypothetical protein VK716_08270 [Terracidiphilus sp.]|nr:hypothetical protein [Terracidiphilus sp.]